MTDRKTPVEQALELFVYAPIGLALTAAEELPKLVEKGREQVTARAALYRMIGKFAVDQGQQTAGRFIKGRTPTTPPPSDDLAIPGYDALSASQVVQRLAGLSADELEAVRAYESATRGRKTIL